MPAGRPPYQPTDKDRSMVRAMVGFGIPEVEIAKVLSIDPKTLRKHFVQELEVGHVEANAKVAASLYRRATGEGREAVIAGIFARTGQARRRRAGTRACVGGEREGPGDQRGGRGRLPAQAGWPRAEKGGEQT